MNSPQGEASQNPFQSPKNAETELSPAGAPPAKPKGHPGAFWFFFWGEFAERSSFYGMRAILPLYLTTLHFSDATAGTIYYWFKMACYFLPLVGGFLADRVFGKYWTIVGFSIPYVLGHFILGVPTQFCLVIALALLAGGSGVIKPNISSLMGLTYDQQRPKQTALRTSAFLWFYFAINIGALISQLALPAMRDHYGYALAFQFPAWLMVISLGVFALGKPFYAVDVIQKQQLTPAEKAQRYEALSKVFKLFGLMVFFWVAYEQNDSLWVYFTRDYVDCVIPFTNYPMAPDQIQFVNALFVLILIPLFRWLFSWLDPQARRFTPMVKMTMGFLATTAAVGIVALAGKIAEGDGITMHKVSLWWVILAYIVLTVGEVLVYGTGLELAYALAPANMKSFITACFLLTNTLGNFINSWLSQLYGGSLTDAPDKRGPLSPSSFFGLTMLISAATTVAFYFVGRQYDRELRDKAEQAG